MAISTANPQCYIKMKISVCDFSFESEACFCSSTEPVNNVFKKAIELAREKEFHLDPRCYTIHAYEISTGGMLDEKKLLIHYFPEGGSYTIRVHIEDSPMRQVLSMG